MAKDYVYAYKGIKDEAIGLRAKIDLPALPDQINPQGTELLSYLKALKSAKIILNDTENKSIEQQMSEMMIDRATLPAEIFYTDVVGHSPVYDEI
jgi:hypothetical protein